ncbi:hypothetical protein [Pedobacter sp. B4-66]|uniref:hypothetical protein n=1 Tax=Pedobacter sp. B4-66 TaxID=2817280 RepID=UPI001BD9CBCA|nr:hypothetical protein [Pedobacter sp. B4-66]
MPMEITDHTIPAVPAILQDLEKLKNIHRQSYIPKKMVRDNWSIKEINGKKVLVVPIGDGEVQQYMKSTEPQK